MSAVRVERNRIGGQSVLVAGPAGAPALVLLHGIGSDGGSFRAQLEEFGGDWRVLAPDAIGYGHSVDPDRPPGIDGYADSVAVLLDAVGITEAALVGVSWGGVIATRFALRYPDRVTALVLADSTRGSGTDPQRAAAMRRRGGELARDGAVAYARRRAPRLLSERAPAALVERVAATMAEAIRLPGYAHAAESMAATDHTAQLAGLTMPTLVLVGADDVVCPPVESQTIAELVPGARLQIIPGAGHHANQERPEPFNAAIGRFLASLHDRAATTTPTIDHREDTTMPTDLESLLDSCVATRDSRVEDWDTLGFQAQAGEEYRRAQIRYIGSGATGDHDSDQRILAAEHFTFSNMLLPPGAVGPEHNHHDVEEVFFVLDGQVEFTVHDTEDGTRTASRVLGYRDLIKVPAGVPRSLRNVGDVDALFCVIIGAPKPQLPTYPTTSAMAGVTRG
ncbi:MAG: alpha/beta fold hydrolase [Nocardioidaceae bacterium]|nr:alpha/beta fold hydrolase [Nocardioidaceae bacterium]